MNQKRSLLSALALSVLPVAAVAVAGSLLVDTKSSWYTALQKPAFNPPPWVFSTAWSIVYLCVIISLFLLFRSDADIEPVCVGVILLCGLLNIVWTAVFFRLHAIIPAAAVLLALICALIYVFMCLYPKNKASAWLFLPHILWGLFALVLNIGFIVKNINF